MADPARHSWQSDHRTLYEELVSCGKAAASPEASPQSRARRLSAFKDMDAKAINDDALPSAADDDPPALRSPALLQGTMQKRSSGLMGKRWQSRHFVLREDDLSYYADADAASAAVATSDAVSSSSSSSSSYGKHHRICLRDVVQVAIVAQGRGGAHEITVTAVSGAQSCLRVPSVEEAERWGVALQEARERVEAAQQERIDGAAAARSVEEAAVHRAVALWRRSLAGRALRGWREAGQQQRAAREAEEAKEVEEAAGAIALAEALQQTAALASTADTRSRQVAGQLKELTALKEGGSGDTAATDAAADADAAAAAAAAAAASVATAKTDAAVAHAETALAGALQRALRARDCARDDELAAAKARRQAAAARAEAEAEAAAALAAKRRATAARQEVEAEQKRELAAQAAAGAVADAAADAAEQEAAAAAAAQAAAAAAGRAQEAHLAAAAAAAGGAARTAADAASAALRYAAEANAQVTAAGALQQGGARGSIRFDGGGGSDAARLAPHLVTGVMVADRAVRYGLSVRTVQLPGCTNITDATLACVSEYCFAGGGEAAAAAAAAGVAGAADPGGLLRLDLSGCTQLSDQSLASLANGCARARQAPGASTLLELRLNGSSSFGEAALRQLLEQTGPTLQVLEVGACRRFGGGAALAIATFCCRKAAAAAAAAAAAQKVAERNAARKGSGAEFFGGEVAPAKRKASTTARSPAHVLDPRFFRAGKGSGGGGGGGDGAASKKTSSLRSLDLSAAVRADSADAHGIHSPYASPKLASSHSSPSRAAMVPRHRGGTGAAHGMRGAVRATHGGVSPSAALSPLAGGAAGGGGGGGSGHGAAAAAAAAAAAGASSPNPMAQWATPLASPTRFSTHSSPLFQRQGGAAAVATAGFRTPAKQAHVPPPSPNNGQLVLATAAPLTDEGVAAIVAPSACGESLQRLWLRGWPELGDASLAAVARGCGDHLELLDVSGALRVTGAGVAALARGCPMLRSIDISGCTGVVGGGADEALGALGNGCAGLVSLDVSGLQSVTDLGVKALLRHGPRPELFGASAVPPPPPPPPHASLPSSGPPAEARRPSLLSESEQYFQRVASPMQLQHLNLSGCRKLTDATVLAVAEQCSLLQVRGEARQSGGLCDGLPTALVPVSCLLTQPNPAPLLAPSAPRSHWTCAAARCSRTTPCARLRDRPAGAATL